MKKVDHRGVRTWIEIDTEALKHNYEVFRNIIDTSPLTPSSRPVSTLTPSGFPLRRGRTKLMAVAKSNAYGHGLFDYAAAVEKLGVDFIGVDSITEAVALQKKGIKAPLLILGYTLPERLKDVIERNISFTVSTLELLEAISRFHYAKKKFKVHLKIDTGLHRQGFFVEDLPKVIAKLKELPQIEIEGVYTHFADAEDEKYTQGQLDKFDQAIATLRSAGFQPIAHASATRGTLLCPKANYDMVRIGMGLMGIIDQNVNIKMQNDIDKCKNINIKPALSWRTVISEIKTLPKGSKIGYSSTETLEHDSKIAILPIGYWHGYPRSLSSIGQVLVRGKRCKVLGRVAMDMTVIDVTNVTDVSVSDVVTIIGNDKDASKCLPRTRYGMNRPKHLRGESSEITALEISKLAGIYHYEFLTRLNPLIKKFYI